MFYDWINEHIDDDPARLRLKYGAERAAEILQIECRKRFAAKLGPVLETNPEFLFPSRLAGEQSTSWALARIHASLVEPGSRVADLTAGLGIDVLAMAARAASVTAVEWNADTAEALRHNTARLGNVEVVNADCRELVEAWAAEGRHFDAVFIDPARRGTDGRRLFALSDCEPDVPGMLGQLRKITNRLIVKASPMLDITQTLRELPAAVRVITLGTTTECKELVAVCEFDADTTPENVAIEAVTATADGNVSFGFTRAEEAAAEPDYGMPAAGDIVFDPFPAVMKAAPIKLLGQRFDLMKIAPNTHLWFSQAPVSDFPGRQYLVTEVLPYMSKHIKRYASRFPRVGVTTRNFDVPADTLRAKLGVKDGADRLFAVTDARGNKYLITCQSI